MVFRKELVEKIIKQGNLPGVLGEKHASGTEIIKELGEEHLKTGKPIIYTSADSVLQNLRRMKKCLVLNDYMNYVRFAMN